MTIDLQDDLLPVLDPARLLGFRNVALVTTEDSDPLESADLAFTKRGRETAG